MITLILSLVLAAGVAVIAFRFMSKRNRSYYAVAGKRLERMNAASYASTAFFLIFEIGMAFQKQEPPSELENLAIAIPFLAAAASAVAVLVTEILIRRRVDRP